MSTMKPRVTSFAPQFLVDDLERSIAYYQKIGFTFGEPWEGFYAIGVLDDTLTSVRQTAYVEQAIERKTQLFRAFMSRYFKWREMRFPKRTRLKVGFEITLSILCAC